MKFVEFTVFEIMGGGGPVNPSPNHPFIEVWVPNPFAQEGLRLPFSNQAYSTDRFTFEA